MNKEITNIDLVEGGNVVKQGDYFTIGYRPRNAKGEAVDLVGKSIAVEIFNKDGIAFESTGEFDPGDGLIYVHVNKNIGYGNMFIEFTVTDPNDAGYRLKFPTNNNAGRLTIHRSTDDLEYVGVKMVTVEQLKADQRTFEQTVDGKVETLKQRVDTGIGAFTSSTEILDARGGEVNLRVRLDKTTAQLAEKARQSDLEIERARISTLVANAGNTDGNAELLDARIGFDGKTYPTVGEAVRALSNYMIEENEPWEVE